MANRRNGRMPWLRAATDERRVRTSIFLPRLTVALVGKGVTFDSEVAKVALRGEHLAGCPGIPSQMFSVLAGCRINIDMIAAASTVIACIVAAGNLEGAERALSQAFLR